MSNLAHNLFLLMLNLSQLKSHQFILSMFLDAINSMETGVSLEVIPDEQDIPDEDVLYISTGKKNYGQFRLTQSTSLLADDVMPLIRNAVSMLAVILEKNEQDQLLSDEKKLLEETVSERTSELNHANQWLKIEVQDRKRAEAKLKETVEDLERKNSELERFTYTVSHDLKSPLVTIKGFLGMLKEDLARGDQEQVQEDSKYIEQAVDKMYELLADLLNLSRVGRQVNPCEEIPFDDIVCDAVGQLSSQIDSAKAQIKIIPSVHNLYGDRIRFVEVFQNLIENSIKYRNPDQPLEITIGVKSVHKDELTCYVQDNGMGIEPKYYHRIFNLFDQLAHDSEGSGVGLTIVKRVIEFHQGSIWVESPGLGKGATFYISLPIRTELTANENIRH